MSKELKESLSKLRSLQTSLLNTPDADIVNCVRYNKEIYALEDSIIEKFNSLSKDSEINQHKETIKNMLTKYNY